jgi:hypothetical protein
MPSLGFIEAYGGETAEYHNAFAFYQLSQSLLSIGTASFGLHIL